MWTTAAGAAEAVAPGVGATVGEGMGDAPKMPRATVAASNSGFMPLITHETSERFVNFR
jgi:hypothetical protein